MNSNLMGNVEIDHIFVLDDDIMVLEALVRSIDSLNIKVSYYTNAKTCLQNLKQQYCSLLITDVKMPEVSGIDIVQNVHNSMPALPIIVMTGYADVPMAVKALKLGAKEFLEKPFEEQIFLNLVKKYSGKQRCVADGAEGVSPAELAVLRLVAEGKSNKEIAHILGKSTRTIENQRHSLCKKLSVQNAADLVRKALELGLVR